MILNFKLVQNGWFKLALDEFQHHTDLNILQEIRMFLLSIIVGFHIIPKDSLFPIKESLGDLPSQLAELLELLKISSGIARIRDAEGVISFSSLHYQQAFVISLIAVGSSQNIWIFPAHEIDISLHYFVRENEGILAQVHIQLFAQLIVIFAKLDKLGKSTAMNETISTQSSFTTFFRCLATIVLPSPPPAYAVEWLWSQLTLRDWNKQAVCFWFFSENAVSFYIYFDLSFIHSFISKELLSDWLGWDNTYHRGFGSSNSYRLAEGGFFSFELKLARDWWRSEYFLHSAKSHWKRERAFSGSCICRLVRNTGLLFRRIRSFEPWWKHSDLNYSNNIFTLHPNSWMSYWEWGDDQRRSYF